MQHSTVHLIDCQYILPEFAGVYLIVSDPDPSKAEVALVETNTSRSLPKILEKLRELGLREDQVKWVVVTHAHLDHASGTGAALQVFPNARLIAHPRAARHLIDPSRLVASARGVYGDEKFKELYGEVLPVEASRVKTVEDSERVPFGSGEWLILHARGHANHHLVLVDSLAQTVFTGDAFGMAYPALQRKAGKLWMLPSTSPTDFDGEAAIQAIERMVSVAREEGCSRAALTHFGWVTQWEEGARQLTEDLRFSMKLESDLLSHWDSISDEKANDSVTFVKERLVEYYRQRLQRDGVELSQDEWNVLELDLALNAQGIAWSAKKKIGSREQKSD